MIMKQAVPRRLNAVERLALSAVVIGSLLVFPTWGERASEEESATPAPAEQSRVDDEKLRYRDQMQEIERRTIQLRQELEELAAMRNEIEQRFRATLAEREHDEIRSRAERLEAEGRLEEADLLRRELTILEEQRRLELELREVEADRASRLGELKVRIQKTLTEAGELERDGRLDEARDWRWEAERLERSLIDARDDSSRQLSELKHAHRAAQLAGAVELEQRLRQEGRLDEAERIEAKLMVERARALELERQQGWQLEQQLDELRQWADRLEADGRAEEAEAARRKLRVLLKKLEASTY